MDNNINVSLTTTKYVLATDDGSPEKLQELNIPVCSAEMKIFVTRDSRKNMADLCRRMAKVVHIDPAAMAVYIGEDPNTPESSLVEYREVDPQKYTIEFFNRWEDTQMLLFEFTLQNLKGKPIFVLKGVWNRDKWHSLRIHRGSPTLNILKSSLSDWGTFSTHNLTKEGLG